MDIKCPAIGFVRECLLYCGNRYEIFPTAVSTINRGVMKTDTSDMKIWRVEGNRIFSSVDDVNIPKHNPNHHVIFDF